MANHPLNLALRFFLELAAWAAMGYWGWTQHRGLLRFALAFGLPLLAMVLWGTFRVPNDPGNAPVHVPGLIRLAIEAITFGLAVWLLIAAGRPTLGLILLGLILLHYATSYDRILWLLAQGRAQRL